MFFYLACLASCARYAILYAGSNGYENYRHQADIFTIYQQLIARGFTKSNIFLYVYNDIAEDDFNPYVGQMFHTKDHKVNVYPGSDVINFKGNDVTAQAFYDGIKNLPSTSEDYVFIYYDNHGAPGFLGTPTDESIHADKLLEAFNLASKSNLYKKCLFMIEACFSGSIGKILDVPNLAIITAANDNESSYAVTFDPDLETYLSNEFTNSFIANIDKTPEFIIGELYQTLQKETKKSHVQYFGDQSIQLLPISAFIGTPSKILIQSANIVSLDPVNPRTATQKTLMSLSENENPSIRAKARLQILRNKVRTEKFNIVLDMLVKYIDPKNYNNIMNDNMSQIVPAYFNIVRIFVQKFGEINPDDYYKFNVIKALSATHPQSEIIEGISKVLV